jgi:hypothetical protein
VPTREWQFPGLEIPMNIVSWEFIGCNMMEPQISRERIVDSVAPVEEAGGSQPATAGHLVRLSAAQLAQLRIHCRDLCLHRVDTRLNLIDALLGALLSLILPRNNI